MHTSEMANLTHSRTRPCPTCVAAEDQAGRFKFDVQLTPRRAEMGGCTKVDNDSDTWTPPKKMLPLPGPAACAATQSNVWRVGRMLRPNES
jgi:hypothetical protein